MRFNAIGGFLGFLQEKLMNGPVPQECPPGIHPNSIRRSYVKRLPLVTPPWAFCLIERNPTCMLEKVRLEPPPYNKQDERNLICGLDTRIADPHQILDSVNQGYIRKLRQEHSCTF
ncbi:hypothetical protein AVEN_250824-1 [Araneus ventricosus]|uniref:Uncharacterized protein n=1 Tax=Araneus ventricosus TaxID=182803 RepID=A0A4Y2MHP9_ARAVE|nr:hypothetical protein AVEN_250824-1 [Araneus ventricosus]